MGSEVLPSTQVKYCLTSCTLPNPELSRHAWMACHSAPKGVAGWHGLPPTSWERKNLCVAAVLGLCQFWPRWEVYAFALCTEHRWGSGYFVPPAASATGECTRLVVELAVAEGDDADAARLQHAIDLSKDPLRLQKHQGPRDCRPPTTPSFKVMTTCCSCMQACPGACMQCRWSGRCSTRQSWLKRLPWATALHRMQSSTVNSVLHQKPSHSGHISVLSTRVLQ